MEYEATITLTTRVKAESEDLAKQKIANEWNVLSESNLEWWLETESINQINEKEQ
jgi:hypothetical protein